MRYGTFPTFVMSVLPSNFEDNTDSERLPGLDQHAQCWVSVHLPADEEAKILEISNYTGCFSFDIFIVAKINLLQNELEIVST